MLEAHEVEFVVVGGLAAEAYGAERLTSDADVVAHRTAENLRRLAAALNELNARLRVGGLTDAESQALHAPIDEVTIGNADSSTLMTDAGPIDILRDLKTVDGPPRDYDALVARAVIRPFGTLEIQVADLGDIIEAKTKADRPKDREALPELHRLHELARGTEEPSQTSDERLI